MIALTLGLHFLLVDWGKRHLIGPSAHSDPAFTVELRPVPPPQQPVSLPLAGAPGKPAPRKAAPARHAAPQSIEPPDEPIRETVEKIPAVATTGDTPTATGPATSDSPQAGAEATPAASADANADANPAGTHYHTDPPPSARLEYDVQATYNQMPVHGYGTLDWKTDGKTYRLDGKAEDFLFTFLNFSSSGLIDDFGVSPELYTEKRMRKAATNTHFNRERALINFSSSTESYPRQGGEQDRASLIWQLSAIGRGDAGKYQPGAVIDLFVAGVRDGEVWRVQVLAEEDLTLPTGKLRAWHVVRMPKPGSYDQRIDIWLSPQQEWYPVRLRYTDPRKDGDYLEMSLSELKR